MQLGMDPPGVLGGGGWTFLQKCVKKQKFCLKMRGNRDLIRATFVEQYMVYLANTVGSLKF